MSLSSDTDMIIRSMAREAGAGRAPMRLELALLLAVPVSLCMAVAMVFLSYGVQPDLQVTIAGAPFHHKVICMLALACSGLLLVAGAGRPGTSWLWIATLLPGVALLVFGAAGQPGASFLGHPGTSVPTCLGIIILLSMPALVLIMSVLRATGVITDPTLAGAAAGLLAGALGAAAYAIACRNDAGLFIAVWYSCAVAAVAVIGALAGRRWLAW